MHLYPNVDESKFSELYSSDKSFRPNITIRVSVRALILKRLYGYTDCRLIDLVRCGALEFLYALHTADPDICCLGS